ncbi:hypothetical protein, unlikely [Trypanosoma brucei gambiense DAL972]|uniref:Uncharacterized protein n=1 Tax=Trypanosoma brucei gambiense (strain MHOM/CI/86/DAL972) TaxID=679716 RepID=D0A1A5_TRYB9|nr:hypothetical protein, unlikely [Trypanosoma brucei gambiense DAL972]CBH15047.1 hypothetical protein, unlikely [Trypanosoma brucei gambiense DAL972]|eukprot:XP_011777313.1 hypothetical protein, unlikely [Trypanosoma brucei gambiense DAL972]
MDLRAELRTLGYVTNAAQESRGKQRQQQRLIKSRTGAQYVFFLFHWFSLGGESCIYIYIYCVHYANGCRCIIHPQRQRREFTQTQESWKKNKKVRKCYGLESDGDTDRPASEEAKRSHVSTSSAT